ncbi:hypothetical protein [Jannaschia sp. 2305UL9-9]|uniref:alginate O-acetyltransferase AlgX-related protein n=1 Tax=Jannaschia sp. 2305UL9-9 TaxID=3121638 RepID=UPI003529513B
MEQKSIIGTAARLAVMAAVSAAGLTLASGAARASTFACSGIEVPGVDMVEGTDGTFYRIDPDLHSEHWIADPVADSIAALSAMLEAGGTRLVVVPVPTKALAMPEGLPAMAGYAGYNPDLAATVYGEAIGQLRKRGVLTVDARSAMRKLATSGTAPFHALDTRPTPEGLQAIANAVEDTLAGAGIAPRSRQAFETRQIGAQPLPSPMRTRLQRYCAYDLPPVQASTFVTSTAIGAAAASLGPIEEAAVVGSGLSGHANANFAGFISQATGRPTQSLHVDGEDPYAAISSYMTSQSFQSNRPSLLVWEFPIWSELGIRGDQPLAELIAAASRACTVELPLRPGGGDNRLAASLGQVPGGADTVLMLDTGGTPASSVAFRFAAPDGAQRVKSIHRLDGQILNGRFYLPLSGLWPEGTTGVEIMADTGFGSLPRLLSCDIAR